MSHERQETRHINNAEVLPPETLQERRITVPGLIPAAPLDMPVERFSEALERREDNRKALLRWIQSNLQLGIDYGQIHVVGKDKCRLASEGKAHECINPRHWSKPSLWKPGAEKICGMLGLIPRFPNLKEYESAALRGEDLKVILLKCELHTGSGFVAAEGTGARRIAQDSGDINKSLKMAEKSAHIDATLRVAGLSELFTQDLEDMPGQTRQQVQPDTRASQPGANNHQQEDENNSRAGENGGSHKNATNGQQKREASGRSNQPPANGQSNGGNRITGKQYKYIMSLMQTAGMTKKDLNEHCVQTYGSVVDHITRADASCLIDYLQNR
ncbi:MAG: hypothetical protein ABIL58_14155 [Pseudomonadota bacterium]